MITKKIEKALNEQIKLEAESSFTYLAMASWTEVNGYVNSSEFLYNQATEERDHMLKIFKYINDAGGHALAPEIKKVKYQYKTLEELFSETLKNEQRVTKSINELVSLCLEEKDHSTYNFLQWYVAEQHEEEKLFRTILDLFKIIGTDGKGLYYIDKEMKNIRTQLNTTVQNGSSN